jgi:SAM-dependent methyltransferase
VSEADVTEEIAEDAGERETRNDPAAVADAYGRVAARYADAFLDELTKKPLDRVLLDVLCDDVKARAPDGRVADFGCGSGQVARYCADRGVAAVGVDLSPAMIDEARARHPGVAFEVGDLLALATPDATYAGATAFYAICHLTRAELPLAFGELRRVLVPGGALLVSWHIGDQTLRPADFLGEPCAISWNFFPVDTVAAAVTAAGLAIEARLERAPYPTEHASLRGYLLARRPT